jgi:pimeloyl-ACP methyl ester carboxylesterase
MVESGARPEIGAFIDAGGIKTNYLDVGHGRPVVFLHGSGPGVSAYANWRRRSPRSLLMSTPSRRIWLALDSLNGRTMSPTT